MKNKTVGNTPAKISSSRWLAYATASAATALCAHQAAAGIHYSGPVNFVFPNGDPDQMTEQAFPLDQPGDSIVFLHSNSHFLGGGFAGVAVNGVVSGKFRGPGSFGYYPASKLPQGTYVSKGRFDAPRQEGDFGTLAGDYGRWHGGRGFVGFRFDNGSGQQYGWARIKMLSYGRGYAFKLLDYAYADPGESIKTGQRSESENVTVDLPVEGSLGALASGGAGLKAWRAARQSP